MLFTALSVQFRRENICIYSLDMVQLICGLGHRNPAKVCNYPGPGLVPPSGFQEVTT